MATSLFGGSLGYDDGATAQPSHPSSPVTSDHASSASLPPDLPSPVSDASSIGRIPSPASVASSDDVLAPENPASQWTSRRAKYHRLIRGERQLLAALEQQENDDLSVALYNTHAIKRAGRSTQLREQSTPQTLQRHPKRRWLSQDRWVPAPRWSSWPLEPHRVPAEGEAWNARFSSRDAPTKQLRPQRNRLTDELEECLLHAVSRRARDELACHRNATPTSPPADFAPKPTEASAHNRPYELPPEAELLGGDGRASTPVRGGEGTPELMTPPRLSSARISLLPADDLAPAPLADDDEMLRLARPSAREVLSKLDRLLLALHRSRQNHAQRDRSPNKSQSRDRSRSTNEKDDAMDVERSGLSTDNTDKDTSSREPDTEYPKKQTKLPPRDWSEVLGAAALIGWDQTAVDAAAKRCSSLFDESMHFRKLDEKPVQPQPSRPVSTTSGGDSDTGARPNGWFCQEPDCAHTAAFVSRKDLQRHLRSVHRQNRNATASKLKEQYGKNGSYICPEEHCPRSHPKRTFQRRDRWLAHIQRSHGYEYTGPDLVIAKTKALPADSNDFCCPDPECQRHDWAFPSRWRLNEHLKRVHGAAVSSRPGSRSGASSDAYASASETDVSEFDFELHGGGLHGGVHVDGYLTPIQLPQD